MFKPLGALSNSEKELLLFKSNHLTTKKSEAATTPILGYKDGQIKVIIIRWL